jgi:hypothetical protein
VRSIGLEIEQTFFISRCRPNHVSAHSILIEPTNRPYGRQHSLKRDLESSLVGALRPDAERRCLRFSCVSWTFPKLSENRKILENHKVFGKTQITHNL